MRKFCSGSCARRARPIKPETREKLRQQRLGKDNPHWSGDKVGYAGIHSWIKRNKPKPVLCDACGNRDRLDAANISQEYKRDLDDWEWLCRLCHMTKDQRLEGLIRRNKIRRRWPTPAQCERCGQTYTKYRISTRFCSRACSARAVTRGFIKKISMSHPTSQAFEEHVQEEWDAHIEDFRKDKGSIAANSLTETVRTIEQKCKYLNIKME